MNCFKKKGQYHYAKDKDIKLEHNNQFTRKTSLVLYFDMKKKYTRLRKKGIINSTKFMSAVICVKGIPSGYIKKKTAGFDLKKVRKLTESSCYFVLYVISIYFCNKCPVVSN